VVLQFFQKDVEPVAQALKSLAPRERERWRIGFSAVHTEPRILPLKVPFLYLHGSCLTATYRSCLSLLKAGIIDVYHQCGLISFIVFSE
jgi:hypothetical protein